MGSVCSWIGVHCTKPASFNADSSGAGSSNASNRFSVKNSGFSARGTGAEDSSVSDIGLFYFGDYAVGSMLNVTFRAIITFY
jgi:hypothetical protein